MEKVTAEELEAITIAKPVMGEIKTVALVVKDSRQMNEYAAGTAEMAEMDHLAGNGFSQAVETATLSGLSAGIWLGMKIQEARQSAAVPSGTDERPT